MSKVAFCFLTYENLNHPAIWSTMFRRHADRLSVYIHNKFPFTDRVYGLDQYCIEGTVPTSWGGLSIVHATHRLFQEALKDPDNQFFVLLSNACIPLYNFDRIYDTLVTTNASVIHHRREHVHRFNRLHDKKFFDRSEFRKQSQWMVLTRRAVAYCTQNDFTCVFGDRFHVPDEHYFVNVLRRADFPIRNAPMTHVTWSRLRLRHPVEYRVLSDAQVGEIRRQSPQSLFLRKVHRQCILPPCLDFGIA